MTNNARQRTTSSGPLVPLILVATFIFVIIDHRSDASDNTAFLSGVERTYRSSTFRSDEATAFMGGIDLDFRDAIIEGDEAKLDITAVMGGVNIRVPRTWTVVNRVVPILGGVKDRTNSINANKRLVIEGTVLMGGLDIKN
jgi:predicted membrane protein